MSIYFFHQCIKAEITFAKDMKVSFLWDEVRRAQIRAELDAYYARLYGLARDELRYILDPERSPRRRFPWRTLPRAEGEGNQAVWRVSDVSF